MTITENWSAPRNINTRAGSRTIRTLNLTPDSPEWTAWRHNKDAVKNARFSLGKEYNGTGWQLTHWQVEDGQFEGDIETLAAIIAAAAAAEAASKQAQKIDYVAADYAPLITQAATKLFEWQRPSCQRVIAALKSGNALDASQTGAGKTFVALAACAELGLTPYVIAPLAVLKSWERASDFMGVPLGGVSNYDKARAGSTPFVRKNDGANLHKGERMFAFAPAGGAELFDDSKPDHKPLLILDECFPAGTQVRLADGSLCPIELIREGTEVQNAIGTGIVRATMRKKSSSLVRVFTVSGTVVCTANHRFLTQAGWIAACELRETHYIKTHAQTTKKYNEHLRMVQDEISTACRYSNEVLREILLSEVENESTVGASHDSFARTRGEAECFSKKAMVGKAVACGSAGAANDREQSDAESQMESKGNCDTQGDWSQASNSRRKRDRADEGRSDAIDHDAGIDMECRDFARTQAIGFSDVLQSGLSNAEFENSSGMRRGIALFPHSTSSRSKEGSEAQGIRVVGIKSLEPKDFHQFGGSGDGVAVYNLEVSGHPSYVLGCGAVVHNCQRVKSGIKSLQGRLAADIAMQGAKMLMLSATAAKDPVEMYSIGLALGLHEGGESFTEWACKHGCRSYGGRGLKFTDNPRAAADIMQRIHRVLFPARGTRIRAADVPGYPDNQVSAHLIGNQSIVDAYGEMSDYLGGIEADFGAGKLNKQKAAALGLAAITKARRASERGKLDFIVEETRELVADGFQVVIFLNFREHLAICRDELKLKTEPVWGTAWLGKKLELDGDGVARYVDIDGPAQKPDDRQQLIDDFQAGKSKVILVSLMAGGAGISLHDDRGIAPRQSLISPSYSAIDLVQAAGRIWRAGSHSKATQRIIYASGTIEEEIAASVTAKIANIESLNDGDVMPDSLAKFTGIVHS